ncbi:hypothetical protein [Hymenobacter volaticus]|uniref:Uncharacterized protein n=1 Tax=Hymenobacter volaticus TaxID=2932254 RepID=A0ABY4GFC8_9BACT|nr:hypothetical protein [Hymenobacter volaticus]UOQ69603.1 hypothetical protein MUN86_29290 [Hymenobacter volaticus]
MDSPNATRYANSAEAKKCYLKFTQLVAGVAERYQAYLESEGLAIAACYHLSFHYANARLQINPGLPLHLYQELRQCFVESFG